VKKLIHISLAVLLIASLGMSQIAAGFFHNKHDAHKNSVVLGDGEFAITEHGEHCKLCAIDLITLYRESSELLLTEPAAAQHFILPIVHKVSFQKTFLAGRAPPVLG
jgi:hypothetical protein